ncbi:MAG: glycoside hydrolase family 3 C-terminal domain-containing protein [Candidatus Lokiarchaeota archaeon]|nr:glycoside hydrolase family 3 C-terminal domain-containing protein [Candidatus Lokiarchaeota archaeon]
MKTYLDKSAPIEERVDDLLNQLTLDEKIRLLRGKDFWTTNPIERLQIPAFGMTDGPLGVAYHSSFKGKRTRFPSTIALAASWNKELAYSTGKVMGKETKLAGRHQILGPGVNLIRSPLCGRNFEYLSEDPILSSDIAAEVVRGIQSENIAACIKHYITNCSETKRMEISTEIQERALHEIYIKNFKRIIEKSGPWGLMSCYNKINGVYGSGNKHLLKDILRDELGFTGHVVTDWGASRNVEGGAAQCIKAGLSLEMPGIAMSRTMRPKNIQKALKAEKISESDIDYVVKPLLRTFFRVGLFDKEIIEPSKILDIPEHQDLARKVAEEGAVLMKNDGILPIDLNQVKKIAVIGPNAQKKFGAPFHGGSSAVVPPRFITPYHGIAKYVKGKAQIVSDPKDADVTILVLGMNHGGHFLKTMLFGNKTEGDMEGKDRTSYSLPEDQNKLFEDTIKQNSNTVVLLVAGSPVDCSIFLEKSRGLLNVWYPGMTGGDAVARLVFGEVNPSGKLPVTYPKKLEDHPAHISKKRFPGDLDELKIYFDEGIFVGYRYFDKENIEPQFPFGFGLSYTTFKLSNLRVSIPKIERNGKFAVSVDVKNTGSRAGSEVVQVYISDDHASIERPPIELQDFVKIHVNPGETKTVSVELDQSAFEFYSEKDHEFIIEPGSFTLWVGTSSRDLPLKSKIEYVN